MAPSRIIVVDTGFVLSVAAIAGLPPLLGERWASRTTWPTEVQSELRFRDLNPGRGVPPGLARRARDGAHLWLPAPVELTVEQIERAHLIARQLGGTNELNHIGEAAGVVLAEESRTPDTPQRLLQGSEALDGVDEGQAGSWVGGVGGG